MNALSSPAMSQRASYCISVIIDIEKGYTPAKPSDPGGETKYGISKRSYPHLDIPNLSIAAATVIYYRDYWLPMLCGGLPMPMDLVVLDAAVNQGKKEAALLLQKVCGINPDGIMGPRTAQSTKAFMYKEYLVQRAIHYSENPHFLVNRHSWFMRLFILTSR